MLRDCDALKVLDGGAVTAVALIHDGADRPPRLVSSTMPRNDNALLVQPAHPLNRRRAGGEWPPLCSGACQKRAQRSVDRADANAVLIGKLGHRRALAVPVGDNLLLTVL